MHPMFTFPPIRRSDLSLGAPTSDGSPVQRRAPWPRPTPPEIRSPMLTAPLLVTAGVSLFAALVRL